MTTPFEEWWARVRDSFPTVAEEVAREWLHRHWRHSPWEWLASRDYSFERVFWGADSPMTLRYRLNDLNADHELILQRGDYLVNEHRNLWGGTWLTNYMLEHSDFPIPPLVLDNRDGHLVDHQYEDLDYYAKALLVVEGHTRFELGRYLLSVGKIKPELEFYLMTRNPA